MRRKQLIRTGAAARWSGRSGPERLLSSKECQPVESEAKDKTDALTIDLKDYLRDPYILDFLNLPSASVQESELEQALDVRHESKKAR